MTWNPLETLYTVKPGERAPFGLAWCGPEGLEHFQDTLVAKYPAEPDGRAVEVWCSATPARFYELRVMPAADKRRVVLSTGSIGDTEWVATTARMIAHGMLVILPD